MTVPALSRRTSSGAPYKIITSSTGDTDFYNLALFLLAINLSYGRVSI